MAKLDQLIDQIEDEVLRDELVDAAREVRKQQTFGLVFEEHIPETTLLRDFPIRPGMTVYRRDDTRGRHPLEVVGVTKNRANVQEGSEGTVESVSLDDLLVVKHFGEPIYPSLQPVGEVRRGAEKPVHAVINGENYHALQLLMYLYEGKADCIYVDPPYNTGARDWKYNNRYVDTADQWHHSKWLSFMEKRLRLARRLLRTDGVLIVTIDEHEVHHLGMLLERIFPEYLRHMVSIVMNPKGTGKLNFARVDEYAFFCVPDIGESVIQGTPVWAENGDAASKEEAAEVAANDEEPEPPAESNSSRPFPDSQADRWELRHARRRGGESSYRQQRPNQFYPIYIDPKKEQVVRAGDAPAAEEEPDLEHNPKGLRAIWPIDAEGNQRCWRFIPSRMQGLIDDKRLVVGRYNKARDTWTLNYWVQKPQSRKLKTVWWETAHDAGTHGTSMLHKILGSRDAFPFPKSLYAVHDCLAAVVRNRPDALVIDFFAGSGTTMHATALLNQEDGGSRRSVLVTNNEVSDGDTRKLNKAGHFRGDPEFEAHGIFEQATKPRCEAVVSGNRPDRKPIEGSYADGRAMADGFDENVAFYKMDYLDPDEVELGRQFRAILPTLWLTAGGHGPTPNATGREHFVIPDGARMGVLIRESAFRKFAEALSEREDVSHLWLITDSERAFADMRAALPGDYDVSMLYRDYLRNFAINTIRA